MAAERIGRTRWLDQRAGEAEVVQKVAGRIATNAQYPALHSQFIQVDIESEECREIRKAAGDAAEAAAHLRDVLEGIRSSR